MFKESISTNINTTNVNIDHTFITTFSVNKDGKLINRPKIQLNLIVL